MSVKVINKPILIHAEQLSGIGRLFEEGEFELAGGAKLIRLPRIEDPRGSLTFGEHPQHLPFVPIRYFVIFEVPNAQVRGEHAHKELHQLLICLHGSCKVMLDDGKCREEVLLARPDMGLYIPPMLWAAQYNYTSETMMLVLASDIYKADDYIRDYAVYLELVNRTWEEN